MRLTLLFAAVTLAVVVGGGALFVSQLARGLDRSLTLTLVTRADNVVGELVGIGGDPVIPARGGPAKPSSQTAQELLRRAMRVGPRGTYAQLITRDGRLVASSPVLAPHPLLTRTQVGLAEHHQLVFDQTVALTDPDGQSLAARLLTRIVRPSDDLLVVVGDREVVDEAVSRAREQLLVLGITVLVLAGSGAWLLIGAVLRPVERMRREVRDLEARNADVGLRVPKTRDEIARLAETFNLVLSRMHAAFRREQALVADAGHELRTPLTVLKGELELARRPNRTRAELANTVEVAAEETDRLVRLTDDLLFLSREEVDRYAQLPNERFDLVAVAQRAAESASGGRAPDRVGIEVLAPRPVSCAGNRDWIRRAIDNVLANALRHAPSGTSVCVEVGSSDGWVSVRVTDAGAGFPSAFLPHAFDRFSRADDSRMRTGSGTDSATGSGLGLAIVRSIITRHGGTATAANRPEGGAVVTLRWPQAGPLG